MALSNIELVVVVEDRLHMDIVGVSLNVEPEEVLLQTAGMLEVFEFEVGLLEGT